jgi:dynein heavy chain, axonemal
MFEVEDLFVASPATVSRCGMIYMEPEGIGIKPLYMSWMKSCPPSFNFRKTTLPMLESLYDKYVEVLVYFVRFDVKEPVITVDNNLVASMCRILDTFFNAYRDTETTVVTADQIEELEEFMESIYLYAITWSIGITGNAPGRKLFDVKFRELMGKDNKQKIPAAGDIYDYCFYMKGDVREWRKWMDTVAEYSVPQKAAFADVVVPTTDSVRMKYLMKTLLMNRKHFLCAGPTGTGKTINIQELLNLEMDDSFNMMPVNFSAQTSAL